MKYFYNPSKIGEIFRTSYIKKYLDDKYGTDFKVVVTLKNGELDFDYESYYCGY